MTTTLVWNMANWRIVVMGEAIDAPKATAVVMVERPVTPTEWRTASTSTAASLTARRVAPETPPPPSPPCPPSCPPRPPSCLPRASCSASA
eukprot:scaffold34592_cov63-Phaeocystis_antarctica.AAC.3